MGQRSRSHCDTGPGAGPSCGTEVRTKVGQTSRTFTFIRYFNGGPYGT